MLNKGKSNSTKTNSNSLLDELLNHAEKEKKRGAVRVLHDFAALLREKKLLKDTPEEK